MPSPTTAWTALFMWMLPCHRARGIFECGEHGKFEYCIDEIPGCVVGCHCHPGYYFDTETKICEPNTKLTLNYQHRHVPQPRRFHSPTLAPRAPEVELLPTLTTHNIIDKHVDDITKNADELGDWLYNQFFKTIENQVINNTNKHNQLTRRSSRGSMPKHKKLKRRYRKGNKHKKQKGIRGKLLRIAEDDSLFQSSESSASDSSESDFGQTSSFESDSNEDHGHKKILLINKKPKPPLPSFIFLPNMNTPYYPPIGLPPPAVMPMYPIVPVPPMMPAPPLLPLPGHVPECDENVTTAKSETPVPTTKVTSTENEPTKGDSTTATIAHSEVPSTDAPALRNHYKGRKGKKQKSLEYTQGEDEESQLDFYTPTRESRQNLIKRLRKKISNSRINDSPFQKHKKPFYKYINQLTQPDILMENDINYDDVFINKHTPPANLEETSDVQNVDFKYLSQLIHRTNENQTQEAHHNNRQDYLKPIDSRSKNIYHDYTIPVDSGRRQNQYIPTSRITQVEDSYYSNLGRQIATLIRTIDADKERQFNIEIENIQRKPNDHPYFNENGPRTFWERSVRSPLTLFHSYKSKVEDLKNSNELLFNIENKVETAASTVPTLSLLQLENMINVMETARKYLRRNNKIKKVKPSIKNFNVHLWPQEIRPSQKLFKSNTRPKSIDSNSKKTIYSSSTRPETLNKKLKVEKHNTNPFRDLTNIYKLNDPFSKSGSAVQPALRNTTELYSQPVYKLHDGILQNYENNRHSVNSAALDYSNIKKYFFDSSNEYSFQNSPVQYSPVSRVRKPLQNKLLASSPMFHHETNLV